MNLYMNCKVAYHQKLSIMQNYTTTKLHTTKLHTTTTKKTFIVHHYLNERIITQPTCFSQLGAPSQRQEEECPLVCCVEVLYYRWTNTHGPDVCSRGRWIRLHWIGTRFHQITPVRIPVVGLDQKHSSMAAEIIFSPKCSTSFLLFVQLFLLQCKQQH